MAFEPRARSRGQGDRCDPYALGVTLQSEGSRQRTLERTIINRCNEPQQGSTTVGVQRLRAVDAGVQRLRAGHGYSAVPTRMLRMAAQRQCIRACP